MNQSHLLIKKSLPFHGTVRLSGAKNAVLAIMASLLLTKGKSKLTNVPKSLDVLNMIALLEELGAQVDFEASSNILHVDTSSINSFKVSPEIMDKMRASILVMGPLLARFGKAHVALPGGCLIGTRPVDYHLNGFQKLGVDIKTENTCVQAHFSADASKKQNRRIAFEYPSVGATENMLMFSVILPGTTTIVNAALEPEVLDLIIVLKKMGADIICGSGMEVTITGVSKLYSIDHKIIPDRLEAGSLLLAAAATGGSIHLPDAQPECMDIFLDKLFEMGHAIDRKNGVAIQATDNPKAISFKTGPYPGFPTDLQAPMMAALTLASGTSEIEETVFENRMMHVHELIKMGAQITLDGSKATVRGVDELYGCEVIATDIRASCALVIAGLAAQGSTKMTGIHHWNRGYDYLEEKLKMLGADIELV